MIRFAPLAAALTVAAIGSAFAQDPATTQGLQAPPATSIIDGAHRSRFTAFLASQNHASVPLGQEVRVGAVLPDKGVTYYAVPADLGARGYRYTVVNDRTVLVHPATHEIVEIVR